MSLPRARMERGREDRSSPARRLSGPAMIDLPRNGTEQEVAAATAWSPAGAASHLSQPVAGRAGSPDGSDAVGPGRELAGAVGGVPVRSRPVARAASADGSAGVRSPLGGVAEEVPVGQPAGGSARPVAVRSRAELAVALTEVRKRGTVALVPTMGTLHERHRSLL